MRFFLQRLLRPSGGGDILPLILTMTDEISAKRDLAEKLLQKGKYDEAIVLLEEIHQESPEEDPILLMLSWAYFDSGKLDRAEKCLNILFDRELERKVFTGFAFDELVRIYKQKKDFLNLVNICEKAAVAQPDDVGLLNELGNAYLQSGHYRQACGIYEKLIEMENDNPFFYCSLGEAFFAAGLYQESEQAYWKAGEIDPDQHDRYYFKIATLFQQAQNYRDAERLFNKCVSINPSNPLYYCSLGDCLIGLDQMKNAQTAYDKAVQVDQAHAGAYYNRLGHSFMKAGKFLQAADAFQAAIKHEPVRHYYLNLAAAYREMGLSAAAETIVHEINKIDGN